MTATSLWRRLDGASRRARALLCLLSGALAGLGHVPFSLLPLSLAGFALMFLLLAGADDWRRAARVGFLAGLGYFTVALHWLVEPFLVDAARQGWMAPFALFAMVAGLSLFWGAAFAAARRAALARNGLALALAWAAALALAELARGKLAGGFPWAMPAYVFSETPAIRIAALTGPYGLTALALLLTGLAAAFVRGGRPLRLLALIVPLGVPLAAGWLLDRPDPVAADAPLVRLVQPNAPQDKKWHPDFAHGFFDRQVAFTAAAADNRPDLVIWPETAVPWRLTPGHPALAQIAEAAAGVRVVVGGVRPEGAVKYNSAAVIGAGGHIDALYDKHHLVPFGEFIPAGGLATLVGLPSYARADGYGFSPGPGPALLHLGGLGRALPLICYEAIFPRDVRTAPARPDWLLAMTNDAWFGTFSGPYQHLAQARFRAVETGLPMVRVANTGVSAMIDPGGRITAMLPLGVAGYLDARLPAARPPTPYARSGEWPWLALFLATFVAVFATRRRKVD